MKRFLKPLAACTWTLCVPVLHAATPAVTFDCDTPAGHYSQWKVDRTAQPVRIGGTVRALELRKEDAWVPGAHVYLYGNDGSIVVGITLSGNDRSTATLSAIVRSRKEEPKTVTLGSIPWSNSVTFDLRFDGTRTIAITAGGLAHVLELPDFRPSAVSLRCTSGSFLFEKVSVTP